MTLERDLTLERFERQLTLLDQPYYRLTLFVNGASELSARAIADIRALCDLHLAGRFRLEILDVHDNPVPVMRHRILASPTLVKEMPLPVRMLVGDLSDPGRVLAALDVRAVSSPAGAGNQ